MEAGNMQRLLAIRYELLSIFWVARGPLRVDGSGGRIMEKGYILWHRRFPDQTVLSEAVRGTPRPVTLNPKP